MCLLISPSVGSTLQLQKDGQPARLLSVRILRALPSPPPGALPGLGMVPTSLVSPAMVGRFFTTQRRQHAVHQPVSEKLPSEATQKLSQRGGLGAMLPVYPWLFLGQSWHALLLRLPDHGEESFLGSILKFSSRVKPLYSTWTNLKQDNFKAGERINK